jgi:uncharacterized membrane protein YeaQ/YmgE (transglycosylase-associated protein family)
LHLRAKAWTPSAAIAEGTKMSIIAWLVVGLIAGWIGSMIVNRSGEGLVMDIVLGIVGALVGGFIFQALGHSGVTGINLYSIGVAIIGAIVVLLVYHAIVRRRTY